MFFFGHNYKKININYNFNPSYNNNPNYNNSPDYNNKKIICSMQENKTFLFKNSRCVLEENLQSKWRRK